MFNPPGHQPGNHVIGTTVPIPYAMGLTQGTPSSVPARPAQVQRPIDHPQVVERIVHVVDQLRAAGVSMTWRRSKDFKVERRLFRTKEEWVTQPLPAAYPIGSQRWSLTESARDYAILKAMAPEEMHETGVMPDGSLVTMTVDLHQMWANSAHPSRLSTCLITEYALFRILEDLAARHGIALVEDVEDGRPAGPDRQ